jgi:integration host factor subunit alpha
LYYGHKNYTKPNKEVGRPLVLFTDDAIKDFLNKKNEPGDRTKKPFFINKRRPVMSLTKVDIIDTIYEKLGIPKKECAGIIESVFDIIKDDLNNGNDVMISGFGKWMVKSKKKRKGRNPQTGKELMIEARRVVTFRPSQVLKKTVNG